MTPQRSKHGRNRLGSYRQIHETVMQWFVREGFVLADELVFRDVGRSALVIEGGRQCLGDVRIDVHKLLRVWGGEGPDAEVQTIEYSYNVVVDGIGNRLRYDSAHLSHNPYHHVHRYDVLAGDKDGTVTPLHLEDEVPTLGEVLAEVRAWYFEHSDHIEAARKRR